MRGWRIILILSALLWGSLDAFAIRAVHPENPCTGDFGGTVSRARYYNPQVGRFWTMDTFPGERTRPLSLHKYNYGVSNPVNTSDPTGHEAVEIFSTMELLYRDSSGLGGMINSGTRKRFDPHKKIEMMLSSSEFTLMDEAAKTALLGILDESKTIDEEFSGVIVWTQSRFRYCYPVEGFRWQGGKASYSPKYFILGAGMKLAAGYHTHGNFNNEQTGLDEGSSKFSHDDKAWSDDANITSYLGTPNGEIKRYDADPNKNEKGKTWVIYSTKRSYPRDITEEK